jgi:type IV pilus assembly protein PilX
MNKNLIGCSTNMTFYNKQAGIVLFVSLIFILMVTMLAVVGIQSTTLTERIAGNSRDKSLAFQAAETALRDTESFMASVSGASATFNDTNGFYNATDGVALNWNAVSGGYRTSSLDGVNHQPQSMIELLPEGLISDGSITSGKPKTTTSNIYRITSRGTGNGDASIVMLQSIYRRRQ